MNLRNILDTRLSICLIISFSFALPCLGQTPAGIPRSASASIPAATAVASPTPSFDWVTKLTPPRIYSAEAVRSARDQIKRVGWTETVLNAQLGEDSSPTGLFWLSGLRAALLGTPETVQQSIEALSQFENSYAPKKTNDISIQNTIRVIQTYDLLHALPEWSSLEDAKKKQCADQFQIFLKKAISAQKGNLLLPLRLRTVALLAGLVSGVSEYVQEGWQSSEGQPDYPSLLSASVMPEGWLKGTSLALHVEQANEILLAATALNTASADWFAKIAPVTTDLARIIHDLAYPNGYLPAALSQDHPNENGIALLLERGRSLANTHDFTTVLDWYYKDHNRPVESLLIPAPAKSSAAPAPRALSAMPQTGAVVLHDVTAEFPLSVYMDLGLSGRRSSSDLLSVEWKNTQPDNPSPAANAPTDQFNTVVIDRHSQPQASTDESKPRNAWLASCQVFQDNSVYVKAIADPTMGRPAYPEGSLSSPLLTYERSLFLCSPYVIDLFRVRGGALHDWIYHAPAKLDRSQNREWSSWNPENNNEYPWLKSGWSWTAKGIYCLPFPAPTRERSHRVWFLDPVGSQVITADDADHTSLVVRREMQGDEGDLFAVIDEWIPSSGAPSTKVIQLPLDPASNPRGFQAVAFAIERENETQIFLSSMTPDTAYQTDFQGGHIAFQGTFGHILLRDGVLERLHLVGGPTLRYNTNGIQMNTAFQFGVLRGVTPSSRMITVDFPNPLPGGNVLNGNLLMAVPNHPEPVMFQPLVMDQVKTQGSTQRVSLRYRPSRENDESSLGAPVVSGDQLMFENFAELHHFNQNGYSLLYSAPADVTIDAATENHRVFFTKCEFIHRVRGESMVGTVQFHLEPQESKDGSVEFFRIP